MKVIVPLIFLLFIVPGIRNLPSSQRRPDQ